ncbi:cell wall protein Pwp1 [Schizosaccharomyces cryophilus OY26]|uniref:Cell wall protein Pwp1 n=1 Tax=Schizosaccharomyces cryophilus (strain OY26 / ATCC MYA-4695 / CBS 11777 / NBRC 106824 / NRRL Y48691) TaxID=653667 RepID=S9XA49_SCHCR|nr:cell wall protein Pwp1 [Schizosaccharomyces cryophilus OY26]EPY50636.1 cell wall protein Pwp1 [Schizosaccharomyces cryophilus OY26]
MLFRAGFLVCLASAFVANAIQFNSPEKGTVWTSGETNTVSWTPVNTDPSKINVVLVNMHNWPNRKYNLGTVETSKEHLDTDISFSSDLPTSGWQIYLNSVDDMNTGSLAQSEEFSIKGGDQKVASNSISGGIVSSTSSSTSASSTPASSSSGSSGSSSGSSAASSSSPSSSASSSAPVSSSSTVIASTSGSSTTSLTSAVAKTMSGSSSGSGSGSSSGFATSSSGSGSSNSKGNSSSSGSSSDSSGVAAVGMTKLSVAACFAVAALMLLA